MTAFRTIDGRQLPPPEPFERTVEVLDELPDGQHVVLLLDCTPGPLFNYLQRHGYRWSEDVLDDGSHAIRIERRKAP